MEAWSVVFDDDPELGELLDLALGDANAEAAAAAGHKRRMMAAVASMNAPGGQGPQGKKHKVDAFSWEKHVRRLTMKQSSSAGTASAGMRSAASLTSYARTSPLPTKRGRRMATGNECSTKYGMKPCSDGMFSHARGRSRILVVLFLKRELQKAGTWLRRKVEAAGEAKEVRQFLPPPPSPDDESQQHDRHTQSTSILRMCIMKIRFREHGLKVTASSHIYRR